MVMILIIVAYIGQQDNHKTKTHSIMQYTDIDLVSARPMYKACIAECPLH